MPRNNIFLLVVCLSWIVLLVASCTKVNLYAEEPDVPRVPVELSPQISGDMTRVEGNEWNLNDALGVFMLRSGGLLQSDQIVDGADNHCYLTTPRGAEVSLTPADDNQIMYYPTDGSFVDFVAYYPYRDTGTGDGQLNNYVYPVRVDDQSDVSAIDLLYSTGSGSKSRKTVVLNFAHQLSKIRITVNKAAELASVDLSDMRIVLNGMPLASGFSLSSGAFDYLNPSGSSETGDITTRTVTDGECYEALVLPQLANAYPNRLISFVPSENSLTILPYSYQWAIPADTAFCSGKEYTFNFTLRASGVDFASLTIGNWDDYSFEAIAVEMVSIRGGTINGTVVGDFAMGRFPVKNSEYAAFLNAVQKPDGGVWLVNAHSMLTCTTTTIDGANTYRWRPAQGYEAHPVTGVSWYGAYAFAQWYGGNLPTAAQWEYVNLYDLYGNVWEWCADWYTPDVERLLRRGGYDTQAQGLQTDYRYGAAPESTESNRGFRVVK